MLRLSPAKITIALLLLFTLFLGLEHAIEEVNKDANLSRRHGDDSNDSLYFSALPLWLSRLDYDYHLKHRPLKLHDPNVVIAEINEKSIQTLGQWPFTRRVYGEFIRQVNKAGAKVVGFDIVFPEVENSDLLEEARRIRNQYAEYAQKFSDRGFLPKLDERLHHLSGDDDFVDAIKKTKVPLVLGFAFSDKNVQLLKAKDISVKERNFLRAQSMRTSQISPGVFGYSFSERICVAPHMALLEAMQPGSSVGAFVAVPDSDSVIREAALAFEYSDGFQPSLGLRTLASYLGVDPILVKDDGLWIRDNAGKLNVPIEYSGNIHLGYYGGSRVFEYIEFSDIVEGKVNDKLKDKIIFVGATATALKDIRANPFDKDFPGVEVHATLVNNILDHSYLIKDSRYFISGYLSILILGLLSALLVFRLHPFISVPASLVLMVGFDRIAQEFGFNRGVIVPIFYPISLVLFTMFSGILYRFLSGEKEKKYVRDAFSRYVSGAVVEEILRDPTKLVLGGQKKFLAIMFTDLEGFTSLSEKLEVEQLTKILNQYFTSMTKVILKHRGTLDKYMGDGIICFWGAPLDLENSEELSCRAALDMIQSLAVLNIEWKQKFGFELKVRIGINNGVVSVGNMGSEQVFNYTVLGDNANLSSRLEGANKEFGTTILVSDPVYQKVKDKFLFRDIDLVQVKGKDHAVGVYELIGPPQASLPEWIHAFQLGMTDYRQGRFGEAEASFATALTLKPEDLAAKVFLERIQEFKKNPPQEWAGVWKLANK